MSSFKEAKETVRSGERTHSKPGRTVKSPARGSATVEITPDEDDDDKKRTAPKLDLNFSIKLGQARRGLLKRSEQQNTGANVEGSFFPDNRAGGGYGTTTLPEETELMTTPAFPEGDEAGVEVSNIKVSRIADRVLSKMAASQPSLPTAEDETPGRVQPAGKPKTSPFGANVGIMGGAVGGTRLGATLARHAGLTGGAALAPVVGGALGGAAVGGLAGHQLQKSFGAPEEEEATPEELELQQLLQTMQQQNPEFYQEQTAGDLQRKVAADVEEKKNESGLPWWVPLAASGAMSLGGYGLSRIPFKASMKKFPALRKIQDMAKGKMTRSDILDYDGVDYNSLSRAGKIKRYMKYGPEVAPEDLGKQFAKQKSPAAVWQGDDVPSAGTFNPALGTSGRRSSLDASDIIDNMDGKLYEAKLLEKYAPGTGARSLGMEDIAKKYGIKLKRGKNLPADLKRMQKALKQEFGDGYIIKTNRGDRIGGDPGVASSGIFPTEKTDLGKAYGQWKTMQPKYKAVARKAPNANTAVEQFRTQPGYEGRIVDEMLHNNAIIQERLPLLQHSKSIAKRMKAKGYAPTQENRIHVVGGKAVPNMAMQRYPALHPRAVVDMWKARRAAKWTQREVLDKLPAKYRNLSYGMDIAPVKGGGYRVIETNAGGQSGLLTNPLGAHGLHKAVTGRYSQPVAAGIGAASAVAGGAGGLAAQQISQPAQKGRVVPPPPAPPQA